VILKAIATLVCRHYDEGGYCGCYLTFERRLDEFDAQGFRAAAIYFFRDKGWRLEEPAPNDKVLCPLHNGGAK
jgi:hypothetical protein